MHVRHARRLPSRLRISQRRRRPLPPHLFPQQDPSSLLLFWPLRRVRVRFAHAVGHVRVRFMTAGLTRARAQVGPRKSFDCALRELLPEQPWDILLSRNMEEHVDGRYRHPKP